MKEYALLFILLAPSIAFANGWSQTGKIIEIYNLGWTIMVKMDGTPVDHSAGQCSSIEFYAINKSDEAFDPIFSQILTAYASGKTTKFWIGSPCSGQNNNYQNIFSIRTY